MLETKRSGLRVKKFPVEVVQECFQLHGDTVYWREDRPQSHFLNVWGYNIWKAKFPGRVFGAIRRDGNNKYRFGSISVQGKENKIFAHIVAFILHNNRYPADELFVDHIDGNGLNNNPSNLREVSRSGNRRNARKPWTNKSGHVGVSWNKRNKKWQVVGAGKYLGIFNDLAEAIEVRKAWQQSQENFTNRHGE